MNKKYLSFIKKFLLIYFFIYCLIYIVVSKFNLYTTLNFLHSAFNLVISLLAVFLLYSPILFLLLKKVKSKKVRIMLIIAYIPSSLVLFVFTVFLLMLFLMPRPVKSLAKYNECLNTAYYKSNILHFPKEVPPDAKNVKFYCMTSKYVDDGELIFLKFKTNQDYIKKELSSKKFINSDDKVGAFQNVYNMPLQLIKDDYKKYTYYVISDDENKKVFKQYFPYFTGIGVDKDLKTIIYYYITPRI